MSPLNTAPLSLPSKTKHMTGVHTSIDHIFVAAVSDHGSSDHTTTSLTPNPDHIASSSDLLRLCFESSNFPVGGARSDLPTRGAGSDQKPGCGGGSKSWRRMR
ncbi:hypothetical protein Bca4012_067528 [Brassica carinata]